MVALPVAVGVLLNTLLPGMVRLVAPLCPLFAVLAVSLICSSVIASSSSAILSGGLTVIAAVLLLHTAGFSMGFVLAKLLGFPSSTARTISIEVGAYRFPHTPANTCSKARPLPLARDRMTLQMHVIILSWYTPYNATSAILVLVDSVGPRLHPLCSPLNRWDVVGCTFVPQVGMQNSALGAVLATQHFASPLTAIPCAISASCHSCIGSVLAGAWRLSDRRGAGDADSKDGAVVYRF
jgi:hypothetical protein